MAINVDLHETIRMIVAREAESIRLGYMSEIAILNDKITSLADALAAALVRLETPAEQEAYSSEEGSAEGSGEEAEGETEGEESAEEEAEQAPEEQGEIIVTTDGEILEEVPGIVEELTPQEALDEIEPLRTHPFVRPVKLPGWLRR